MRLSARQLYLAQFGRRDSPIVLATGPVRSGKTEGAGRGWIQHVGRAFSGHDVAVVTRSHAQMLGVVVALLSRVYGQMGLPLARRARWYDAPDAHGGVNRIWPVVANDASSVDRVQGFTLASVWADEAAVLPWEMLQELLMRLSVGGAKLVCTTNPEGPTHPIKTEWIDLAERRNIEVHPFSLHDNPALGEEYIERLRHQFTGPVYLRKVLGLWAAATGLVLPGLADAVQARPRGRPDRLDVSCDWAQSSITHAIMWARYGGQSWAIGEWRHDGRDDQLLPEEQARRLAVWADGHTREHGHGRVTSWIVDPTSSGLMVALRREQPQSHILPAVAEEQEGIQVLHEWLRWRLRVAPECLDTIAEAGGVTWDESAAARSRDTPQRGHDHALDAMRYYAHTVHSAESLRRIRPEILDPYAGDLPGATTAIMGAL